jgi:hypothetical protein
LAVGERLQSFFGRAAVLRQSPFQVPAGLSPRFGLNPRIACKDQWKRIEALQSLKAFIEAHALALRDWINGNREVVFPFGTYLMRVFHRARCAPAPA